MQDKLPNIFRSMLCLDHTEMSTSADQFRYYYIECQPKTINLSMRLWERATEFVRLIPQSLVLRSIVLG